MSIVNAFLVGGALVGGGLLVFKYRKRIGLEGYDCEELYQRYRTQSAKKNFGVKGRMNPTKRRYRDRIIQIWHQALIERGCIGSPDDIDWPDNLTGLRADRLQLPTTGHIERMEREADRFKVIQKKLAEDLRDSLCVQAHRRMRDLLRLGGRIESHAQSVGLPEEMTPFLEKLRKDMRAAEGQFDMGCQVSRRGRGRVPKARRAVRTWI